MLKKLTHLFRKHERLALFVLAIITALAFGISGQMLSLLSSKNKNVVGKVYNKELSAEEISDIKSRWRIFTNFVVDQNKPYRFLPYAPPFNLADYQSWLDNKKEEYYQGLALTVALMVNVADQTGIKISTRQIQNFITSQFAVFRERDNSFNFAAYRSILYQQLQISESAFEKTIEELLKIFFVSNLRLEAQVPILSDIFQQYISDNEEIKIRWAEFNSEDYVSQCKTNSPEEIEQFFKNNIKDYQIPEKVQLEYIIADYDRLKNIVRDPTPDELTAYYEKNKENYRIASFEPATSTITAYKPLEEVHDEVKAKWKESEIRIKAVDVIAQINERIKELSVKDKAIDLKSLASEFSLWYGETPFFGRDRVNEITKEIGSIPGFDQVFYYPENVPSEPISSEKGQIIFRIIKKKPSYTPTLTLSLKEKINGDLGKWKAKQSAETKAKDVQNEIIKAVTQETMAISPTSGAVTEINKKCYETIVKNKGFKINQSVYFKRDKITPQLKEVSNDFINNIFNIKISDFNLQNDKGVYYLIQVIEKRLPNGEDLEIQKAQLERKLQNKQVQETIKKWQAEIKELTGSLKTELTQPPSSPKSSEKNTQ